MAEVTELFEDVPIEETDDGMFLIGELVEEVEEVGLRAFDDNLAPTLEDDELNRINNLNIIEYLYNPVPR